MTFERYLNNNVHPMSIFTQIRRDYKNRNKVLFDFSLGDSIEPTPPEIIGALKDSVNEENMYPRTRGNEDLRIICSDFLQRRYSIKVNPENEIAITSGNKEAIFHFPLSLKESNERKKYIIYGKPAYPGYHSGCNYSDYEEYVINLQESDNFLLPFWEIPISILNKTKLIWINYPHNPTGTTANMAYLKELYSLCIKYNIIIASDDCYADLWYISPTPSIAQINLQNSISFHTSSKRSNMAGIRSGFMFGDSNIVENYLSHRAYFGNDASTIVQNASKTVWSDENHVKKNRDSIIVKAKVLKNKLEENGLTFPTFSAGIFLFGKLPNNISDIDFSSECLNNDILIVPSQFLGGPRHFVRISLSPTLETIEESLANWPTLV
jgi:aspartate/methionine/tyrosine aminotransferase